MTESVRNTAGMKGFLWNVFASGLPIESNLNIIRKLFLLNLIGILGTCFLGFFSVIALLQGEYILALADITLTLVVVSLFVSLRKKKNTHLVALIGTIATGCFFLFLIFAPDKYFLDEDEESTGS